MATLTINFTPISPAPANGYIVNYRVKGTTGAYTTVSPNPTTSPVTITGLLAATEYEGTVQPDCGFGSLGAISNFSTCTCATGFSKVPNKEECEKIDIQPAIISHSNYCLAPSNNFVYSSFFSRIYNQGFSNTTISEVTPTIPTDVYGQMTLVPQWVSNSAISGPMNRAGVWIDSDCDGVKDALALGTQTTIAYAYDNQGASRTVYVGVGADNQFILKVNGTIIAQTTVSNSDRNFKIWHIFPVNIIQGFNDFNVVATGDGSVNDAIAMVIYDNAPIDILNAPSDSQLSILFTTQDLRGTHIDIATCSAGYSLDTSGGQGTYVCRKITTQPCGGAP